MIAFIEKHKILYDFQYGFRKNHSTTLALIDIVDKIKFPLDKNEYALGIFLDITKALDSISHDIFLTKLEHYGFRGHSSNFINSLRPRPNRCHFADDISKCIFQKESEWISPRISLKFVPKVGITNTPALVQIMAWRWPGDKPLSEPMMVSLLTHICVARPQWVKSYLTGRKQFLSMQGHNSDIKSIGYGVPQGSVLGPLLFLLYINDIQHAANNTHLRLFADDAAIFFHSEKRSWFDESRHRNNEADYWMVYDQQIILKYRKI